MSTFVLKRGYELQLPMSFVDVDRDEMEYVDGGMSLGDFCLSILAGLVSCAIYASKPAIIAALKAAGGRIVRSAIAVGTQVYTPWGMAALGALVGASTVVVAHYLGLW